MMIYGTGLFLAPNSSRVVWDFIDGPFGTVNPVLIHHARRMGYSFTPLEPVTIEKKEPARVIAELPKDTPARRGRKPKGVTNVNSKTDRTDRNKRR
jgi:hypothetical protein